MPPVAPVKAVVFDAYGTLFDVHSVIQACEALFPGKGAQLSQLWRSKQLEYTWLRSLMGRYEEFEAVTRSALQFACASLDLQLNDAATGKLLQAYRQLSVFPEVKAALEALADRPLAVLSNGSPAMLEAVVRNSGLDRLIGTILSVDRVKIFKPHPSVYQLACDALQVAPAQIAFVSSNYWDVAGAASFGFRCYWVNRSGARADELGFTQARTLRGLDELPQVLAQGSRP